MLDEAVGGLIELELGEQLGCARPRRGAIDATEPPDHLQVLEPGEVLVDGRVLAGEADLRTQLGGVVDDVEADDSGLATARRQQRGQDSHRCGLAGAVGPEQPEHGTRLDLEVDSAQRFNLLVGLAQPLSSNRDL